VLKLREVEGSEVGGSTAIVKGGDRKFCTLRSGGGDGVGTLVIQGREVDVFPDIFHVFVGSCWV